MTSEHADTDISAEVHEQASTDEPIPPIISDWTPDEDDYRISTT